ncbi:MAG: serine hydrolase [Bacteroidia bacterium]|nr:serine hydrolase [Bacteroidia bacterium]
MALPYHLLLGLLLLAGLRGNLFSQTSSTSVLLDSIAVWAEAAQQPGIGIAIIRGDSVLYAGGVGYANLAEKQAVEAQTNFRVGSVSKTFVSLGILRLVEAGKISLNDKLADLAPEIPFTNRWEKEHPVRVVHLLEHSAGFDDMHFRNFYNTKDDPFLPLAKILDRSKAAMTARWEPGSRHSYSNPGYTILGYLIEKISGESYEDFLQKEVLTPLQMENSTLKNTPESIQKLATGYEGKENQIVPYMPIYHRPAGSLEASPLALAQALKMFLHRGMVDSTHFLSPELIERMERTEATWAAHLMPRGYGLGNYSTEDHGMLSQGHNGGIDGFYSQIKYYPGLGCGYITLYNRLDVPGKLRDKVNKAIQQFIFPDSQLITPPPFPLNPTQLEEMEGYFQEANPRNQIIAFLSNLTNFRQVSFSGDTLQLGGLMEDDEKLIALSQNTFRTLEGNQVNTVLEKFTNGQIYLQHGSQFFLKTSGGKVYTCWIGTLVFMLFLPAGLIFGLISLIFKLKGSLKGSFIPRALLGAAPLFFICAVMSAFSIKLVTAGEMNATAIIIFLGLLGFGICSVFGLGSTIWQVIRLKFSSARVFMLILGGFYVAGTIYLASYGLMPLQLWTW